MAYWQRFRINNIGGSSTTAEVYTFTVPTTAVTVSSLREGNQEKSVYNSSFQGVNGTFFDGSGVVGIAVVNGQAVRTGGLKNGTPTLDRNRSTMYMTNLGAVGVVRTVQASNLPGGLSNIKWAIGGLGLYLNEPSMSKTTYDNNLDSEGVEGVGGVNHRRPRTMLGVNFNGYTGPEIVMAVVRDLNSPTDDGKGITFYEGRQIMLGLGCTRGIHLDGGGSSAFRFIDQPQDGSSSVIRYQADSSRLQKVMVRSTAAGGAVRFPSPFTDIGL